MIKYRIILFLQFAEKYIIFFLFYVLIDIKLIKKNYIKN